MKSPLIGLKELTKNYKSFTKKQVNDLYDSLKKQKYQLTIKESRILLISLLRVNSIQRSLEIFKLHTHHQSPTLLPTLLPTKSPTQLPTQLPTLLPTQLPTKLPTLLPTLLPTQLPTKLPTLLPTQLPIDIQSIGDITGKQAPTQSHSVDAQSSYTSDVENKSIDDTSDVERDTDGKENGSVKIADSIGSLVNSNQWQLKDTPMTTLEIRDLYVFLLFTLLKQKQKSPFWSTLQSLTQDFLILTAKDRTQQEYHCLLLFFGISGNTTEFGYYLSQMKQRFRMDEKTIHVLINSIDGSDLPKHEKYTRLKELLSDMNGKIDMNITILNGFTKAFGRIGYLGDVKSIILDYLKSGGDVDLYTVNQLIQNSVFTNVVFRDLYLCLQEIYGCGIVAGRRNKEFPLTRRIMEKLDEPPKSDSTDSTALAEVKTRESIVENQSERAKVIQSLSESSWTGKELVQLMQLSNLKPNTLTYLLTLESMTKKPSLQMHSFHTFIKSKGMTTGYQLNLKLFTAYSQLQLYTETNTILQTLMKMDLSPSDAEPIFTLLIQQKDGRNISVLYNLMKTQKRKLTVRTIEQLLGYFRLYPTFHEHIKDLFILYRKYYKPHDGVYYEMAEYLKDVGSAKGLVKLYNESVENNHLLGLKCFRAFMNSGIDVDLKYGIYKRHRHMMGLYVENDYERLFEQQSNVDILEDLWNDFQNLDLKPTPRIQQALRPLIQSNPELGELITMNFEFHRL